MQFKTKICRECGREFTPKSGTQVYCSGPHQAVCEFCGRIFDYTCSPKEKPRYCSQSCINEGKKLTVRKRYGVDNVSELHEVREKISKSNSSEEVKQRRRETSLKNWGVDNPAKHEDVRAKMSATMKSDTYLRNREQTCLERYGHSTPMAAESVKAKQRATNLERYGMAGHPFSREAFMKRMTDSSKIDEYISFKDNPISYIESHYSEAPAIYQLEKDLGVTDTPIYNILIANQCSDLIAHCYSNMEDEVAEFLSSICPGIQIKRNDRTIIKPNELAIYLPEYNIGIECNPASTHNSSRIDPWGAPPKKYDYHQHKSLAGQSAGIFVFHIFGYEWNNHKDIIKSMIANLLNLNIRKLGARQTYVCEVGYIECEKFLNMNHRQGHTSSKVRLGLRMKGTDELVSVMTFSHVRSTIGQSNQSTSGDWELSRFCSLINTTINGAASKLFKYFIEHYEFNQIISFSDIAHTQGKIYQHLGFYQAHVTSPSYIWSDVYDAQYFHRVSCQKRNLRRLLNDDSIDIDNLTEREIMESHKFVRIYDSGVIRWEYSS